MSDEKIKILECVEECIMMFRQRDVEIERLENKMKKGNKKSLPLLKKLNRLKKERVEDIKKYAKRDENGRVIPIKDTTSTTEVRKELSAKEKAKRKKEIEKQREYLDKMIEKYKEEGFEIATN